MPLEDNRLCGCCACQVSWLDISLRPAWADAVGWSFPLAVEAYPMGASDSRTADVYDVGSLVVRFSATVPNSEALLAGADPGSVGCTLAAFGAEAFVATDFVPYFNGDTNVEGSIFDFATTTPVLRIAYAGFGTGDYIDAEWLHADDTPIQFSDAWENLSQHRHGGFNASYRGDLAGSLYSPVSSWLATTTLSLGGGTRLAGAFISGDFNFTQFYVQAWRHQPEGESSGMITVSTAQPTTSPLGVSPGAGIGGSHISHLQWFPVSRARPVIQPDGVVYVRVWVKRNGRSKAGKSFSIGVTLGFYTSVSMTVTFEQNSGYKWSNSQQWPLGVSWDGTSTLDANDVTIDADSEYVVFAITGTPGSEISVAMSHGTATGDDLDIMEWLRPSPWTASSYTRFPPAVLGGMVSVYRDDTLVYQADANPPEGGPVFSPVSALSTHGTYFLVSEKNSAYQQYAKQFASFVVDTESPLVGCVAPNDVFFGEQLLAPRVFATEPLVNTLTAYTFQTVQGGNGGASVRSTPSAVGSYRVQPASSSNATNYDLQHHARFIDRAGNVAPFVPEFDLNIVAVPTDGHRGARPTLAIPAPYVRNPLRGRQQSEKVWWVDLSFDRKVLRSSVAIDQVRLWKTTLSPEDVPVTVAVEPVSIEEVGDTGMHWRIAVPGDEQTERSFWLCEFVPAGVVTDDVRTVEVESFDKLHAESFYKILYVTTDTQKKYSKSPSGYVEVRGNYPLDANGVEYDPEPSLLAARVAWLMAGEGERNPVDVSSYTQVLYPVSTLTAEFDAEAYDGTCTLTANDDGFGIAGFGTYFYGKTAFVPGVPQPTSPPDDCSYFGVRTTIDPCPPRTLGECTVPRVPQRHSSLIRNDSEITGWIITPPEIADADISFDENVDGVDALPAGQNAYQQKYVQIGTKLLGGEVEVGAIVDGVSVPQNTWSSWEESDVEVEPQGWGTKVLVGGYFPITSRLSPPLSIVVRANVVKASVVASRTCLTYPTQETSFLGPLTLHVAIGVFATETITYGEVRDPNNDNLLAEPLERVRKLVFLPLSMTATLTKDQEEALHDGEPITLGNQLGEWTIAAVT